MFKKARKERDLYEAACKHSTNSKIKKYVIEG